MTVYRLGEQILFPSPDEAEPDGLLAIGGDLSPDRLLCAYAEGIFPWYEDGLPILWHSPDPRMVLKPHELRVSRSLAKRGRQEPYRLSLDSAFPQVIASCARTPRPGQRGTWITSEMTEAYIALHELGFAHSAEAWLDDELVGGLYGVSLGRSFFGESMFALASDASKLCFAQLVRQLVAWDFDLIDCQVHTEHLEHFGATEWPRASFLTALEESLIHDTRRGTWAYDDDLEAEQP